MELAATRGDGAPLTHQEVRAWRLEMQINPRPTPWEIKQIMMIDRLDMKVHAEKSNDKTGKGSK